MVTQAADIFYRLHAHIFEEICIGGIDATGKHKILPDQDAIAVAQIVEHILRIIPAAPDAQHVHIGADCALKQSFQHGAGDARREGIGGNPVRALREETHAIDIEREFLAPLIGILAKLDRSQTDRIGPLVKEFFPILQGDFHLVQRLLAIPIRPPQLWIRNLNGQVCVIELTLHKKTQFLFGFESFAARTGYKYRRPGFPLSGHRRLDLRADGRAIHPQHLPHMDILKADRISFEADVLPDTNGRQFRPPIPTPVTGRLTQVRPAGDITASLQWKLRLFRGDKPYRGAKYNVQLVTALTQQVLYLPLPAPEHVFGMPQIAPVEIDIGNSVEPITDETHMGFTQEHGIGCEAVPILPVSFGDPHYLELIICDKWIRDLAQRE